VVLLCCIFVVAVALFRLPIALLVVWLWPIALWVNGWQGACPYNQPGSNADKVRLAAVLKTPSLSKEGKGMGGSAALLRVPTMNYEL
jgi:hypothetical protein